MNTLRNKVSLIGHITSEFTTINAVLQFTLTTIESKDAPEGKTWIRMNHFVQVSGRLIQRMQLVNKGQELIVEGRLKNAPYRNEEGDEDYGVVIEMTEFLILTPSKKNK